MNGNRSAAVASLVPLVVDAEEDITSAPTRLARAPRRRPPALPASRAAAADPTRVERRKKLDIDELPTLVVPPPVSMSSGARKRPKERVDDVASSFDISPFESFEGDVETIADVDDVDESDIETVHARKSELPRMADVWIEADARVEENESELAIEIEIEIECDADVQESEEAQPRGTRRFARWLTATLVVATACAAFYFIDQRIDVRERALAVAENIEGRARWLAARQ